MKLKITLLSLLSFMGMSLASNEGSFDLKGNVQMQATKSLEDEDNNLSSLWVRANIGDI